MTRFSLASALCLLLCISMAVAFTNMKMGHTHLHPEHHLYEHFAERRVNADDAASYWDFQMGGNIYPVGIYWVAVNVGTPPQEMLVAVDSGSSDLLVPGAGCTGCHEQNTGSFNTTASLTLDPIACSNRTVKCHTPCGTQCSFVNSYQTCNLTDPQQPCTVTGPLYSDVYSQGGLTASVIFGVITSQTTNFQQFFNIDGVCGFAFAAGSSWGGTPPFDRLVQAGECNDVFAMCLKPSGGGILTLGGVDPKLFTGSWQYTPMKKYLGEYILYVLDMTDIKVNQKSIGLPASSYTQHGTMGGCVLDSGTNTILLPSPIYTPFITTFNDYFTTQCKSSSAPPGVCDNALVNGQCYQYTQAQIASFPAIQMVFNTVTLEIDGPDYIVNNGTASWYCFGVFNTGARGNLIVGDILMQNYYVQFDKKNHQVGWAPVNAANCVGDATPIIYYPSN